MVVDVLGAALVAALSVAALVLGARGLARRSGHYSSDVTADRVQLALLVAVRLAVLALLLALSVLVLVSVIGAAVRGVDLHGLVRVLAALALLLAVLVLLTFGRPGRRRGRRRASPARR